MNTTFFLLKKKKKKKKNQRPNWPKLKAQKTDNQPKPKLIEFQPFRSVLVENFTNQKFRFWLANPKKTNQTKPITGLPKTFLLIFLYCTKIYIPCSSFFSSIFVLESAAPSHTNNPPFSHQDYIYTPLSHTPTAPSLVCLFSLTESVSLSLRRNQTLTKVSASIMGKQIRLFSCCWYFDSEMVCFSFLSIFSNLIFSTWNLWFFVSNLKD